MFGPLGLFQQNPWIDPGYLHHLEYLFRLADFEKNSSQLRTSVSLITQIAIVVFYI